VRRHVVALTYGEPPIARFGPQLAYSWRILWNLTRRVAPIPPIVLPLIAGARARQRVALWRSHGYASPIEAITREQARALEAALDPGGEDAWRVHVAYEFRKPLLADALAALPAGEPVLVLPLYVAESEFTHDMARRMLAASGDSAVQVVPALDPGILGELWVHHVRSELARRGFVPGPDVALVLAAHGTLLEPPRPMNTGRHGTEAIARSIACGLAPGFGRIERAWLNHTRGGAWTTPSVEAALRDLARTGFRRIVYLPYGFLADNAESELEGRIFLAARPEFREVVHLPCLNGSPELAAALADAVRGVLSTNAAA
jgi:protoheme ferro-lyase